MSSAPVHIRVGILCNGTTFQRWQAEAIREVLAVHGVQLVLLVIDGREHNDRPPLRQLFYRKYREHLFKPPAMGSVDLTTELDPIPRISVIPQIQNKREEFSGPDLEKIRHHRPEVLLRFGFNILSGDILTLPTFGVWSFHHGDPGHYRGGPPGLWEIMNGSKVTGAVLQRLNEKLDGGQILRQGWFHTIDHSLTETVNTVLTRSAIWPAQVLKEILMAGPSAALGRTPEKKGKLYRYPNDVQFLRFLWKQFKNKLRFHRQELNVHEEWNIGVLYQPIWRLLEPESSLNIRWLPAPSPDSFRADPFGYISSDGSLNVLYEKFDHLSARGQIYKVRPRRDSVLKRSRSMLESEGHLSYPYVVEHGGRIYVVPESCDQGRVSLYQVKEDNEGLELVKVLLDVPLIDPTLFQHDGLWWLFGSMAPLSNTTLYAYFSKHLEGPYEPHPLNPLKFDVRSARPAGTPFVKDGILYRPSQDSSETYGGRIAINRMIELSPTAFKEELVKYVGPFSGTYDKGVHTIAAVGDMTLVDGKRFVTVSHRKTQVRKRKLERLKRLTSG
jgi:folate-dependent phosphoribosylglycinamide formyltransferase PurN